MLEKQIEILASQQRMLLAAIDGVEIEMRKSVHSQGSKRRQRRSMFSNPFSGTINELEEVEADVGAISDHNYRTVQPKA